MVRVLIAEDTELIRTIVVKMLQSMQIEVDYAETGTEAIQKYKSFKPTLVFMDIAMPEIDGLTATKEIISYDPKAKICILSAMGDKKTVTEAILAGAKNFLVKPFNKEMLLATIYKMTGVELTNQ